MNTQLENYLHKHFDKIFPTCPKIQCDDGWFYLILWTCRYIHSYKQLYDMNNADNELKQPEILQIKQEDGLLTIKIQNTNEKIDSFIETMKFISGFICEISGNTHNNIIDIVNKKTINEKFLNKSTINKYIDNKELRNIVAQLF